jgi:multiple sugar transport system permease protein
MSTSHSPFGLDARQRKLAHGALILLSLPFILPLVWMVSTSLKSNAQIFTGTRAFSLSGIFPWPWHLQNYPESLNMVPFGTYFKNTLVLCFFNVIGTVVSSATVAYGFACIKFKGRETLFWLMISTMALPAQVTMIPIFALFKWLGWTGTYLPLIVPAFCGNPFYVFLMRQFFMTVPEEIAEAGRIDGAGEWRLFWQLHLPLAVPALTTCALFQFLATWNDFFGPLLYLSEPSQYTVAYGLQQFVSSYNSNWGQLMAASTLFTLPIVLLFFFAQKTFIEGISTTGVKS